MKSNSLTDTTNVSDTLEKEMPHGMSEKSETLLRATPKLAKGKVKRDGKTIVETTEVSLPTEVFSTSAEPIPTERLVTFVSEKRNLAIYDGERDVIIRFRNYVLQVDSREDASLLEFLRKHPSNGAADRSNADFWEGQYPEEVKSRMEQNRRFETKERNAIETTGIN